MKWNYKNIIIEVQEDGRFYFTFNGKTKCWDSLSEAKNHIDSLTKEYYEFKKEDLDKLCKKLDKRESEFVRNLIKELNCHRDNAYCEIGISEDFLFNIKEWLKY